jgi:methylglutaconyl-CoA hydratase
VDARLAILARQLAASNPDAMTAMKRVFWQGTEHWAEPLGERARVSGGLVVSGLARQAIERLSS